tara:strand:- start:414 stop:578 length:165 start_codon:yes stop_codon:yes gene_type:complete
MFIKVVTALVGITIVRNVTPRIFRKNIGMVNAVADQELTVADLQYVLRAMVRAS